MSDDLLSPDLLEKLKARCAPACQKLLGSLPLPEGASTMTAEEIRKSFIQPELQALSRDGRLDPQRSLALAAWELAAQLAEFNDRLAAHEANTKG